MIPFLEREGGVWFAKGGMYSVVEALGRLVFELGSEIRTGEEVRRIEVRDGRAVGVHTDRGFHAADVVVSNADPGHTYGGLVDPAARRRWTDRRLDATEWSMSCFLLYIGTRRRYPQLEHLTLILAERYRELLEDIFESKILPPDFSMYLHAPTRTDPGMAPDGGESMYVLVPVANQRSGLDWNAIAPSFTDRVIDFLQEWGLTDLRAQIDVLHTYTPLDFEKDLNATWGNAFAIEPRFTQTAWFRPHNRSEDIDGLYLVGAGTHPGAGVPGVLLSAEATYGCVADDLGLPDQWDWDEPGRVALQNAAPPASDYSARPSWKRSDSSTPS